MDKVRNSVGCNVVPVKGRGSVYVTIFNKTPYFDYGEIEKVYEDLKGFYIPHECLDAYKAVGLDDTEMVSVYAVIAAIYRSNIPVVDRERLCDKLLSAPISKLTF